MNIQKLLQTSLESNLSKLEARMRGSTEKNDSKEAGRKEEVQPKSGEASTSTHNAQQSNLSDPSSVVVKATQEDRQLERKPSKEDDNRENVNPQFTYDQAQGKRSVNKDSVKIGSESMQQENVTKKRKYTETDFADGNKGAKKSKAPSANKQSLLKVHLGEPSKSAQLSDNSDSGPENIALNFSANEKNTKITQFFRKNSPGKSSLVLEPTVSATKPKSIEKTKVSAPIKPSSPESKAIEHKPTREIEDEQVIGLKEKLKEKDSRISTLDNQVQTIRQQFKNYTNKVQAYMSKKLLEVEQLRREKFKAYLMHQRQRLGEYISQRDGTKFVDSWMDGTEMRAVKEKLAQIQQERDELEKSKKALKSKKQSAASKNDKGDSNNKPFNSTENPNITNNFSMTFNIQFENHDSNSNSGDALDLKDRITSKIMLLNREEALLKEQLERLEHEKFVFIQEYKRQNEEDHCRFGRENKEQKWSAWPILAGRYQFLSLLGKGGFSEVYKCFDLEEMREVACKIHQINPNWSESSKSNYIKHALRENNIQTELNHPNIVRLYDTVEIDQNSFCTVLEYCEGPDLSQYLKRYKSIPEKEAKTIIRQTLCGLKYLNDSKPRVIHYDLKPQNIIFHKGEVKISDFGLCKVLENNETRCELTSQGVGTYWYLPPETFLTGESAPSISSKVDIWALGVIFFEMLYGQRPFGNNMSQEKILKEQVILKSVKVSFPEKSGISKEAKEFITKCLAYNEFDRYDVDQAYNSPYFKKK